MSNGMRSGFIVGQTEAGFWSVSSSALRVNKLSCCTANSQYGLVRCYHDVDHQWRDRLASAVDTQTTSPEAVYRRRCAEFGAQRDSYAWRSGRNGNASLLLFVAGLGTLIAGLWRGEGGLYAVTGVLGVALIASLAHHDRLNRHLRRYAELYRLDDEALHRLRRDWGALPAPRPAQDGGTDGEAATCAAVDRSSAADLDLLGHASLEQLLGTANTPIGQATLRRWILQPAAPATVRGRQAAVAELAPQIDFREEVCLRGRLMGSSQEKYEQLVQWAEEPGWLAGRPWLAWLTRLLTLLLIGLGIAQLSGVPAYPALAVTLFANAAVTLVYGRAVAAEVDRVADRQKVFQAYADMFGLLGSRHFEAPALRRLQEQLSAHGLSADVQMRRLGRLMPLADIRGVMFFFVVEIATLWSFHVLWLLERWKREAGSHARAWLEALGEAESLIALGTLSFDQPGWALPELDEGDSLVLRAKSLAHPLLPSERAVGNDVEVGPPGTFLLVTGSNMSGKSTLLRAIGLNTVLAQMGGPVCASAMQLPPLAVASSMRVQDSLEQGISTFMAELRRLKAIVDLVQSQDCVSATVGAEPVDGPGVPLQPRQAAQLQGPASTRPFGRSAPLTPTDRSVGAADGSRPELPAGAWEGAPGSVPAGRDPPGHQHRRAGDRRPAHHPAPGQGRRHRRRLDPRPDTGRSPRDRPGRRARSLFRDLYPRAGGTDDDLRLPSPSRHCHFDQRTQADGADRAFTPRWPGERRARMTIA